MHDFTRNLLGLSALIIAIGAVFVVKLIDPNLLNMSSLQDVGKYYGVYFLIVFIAAITIGIFLGFFERALDELFG